jgi:hypothetical protein
MKKRFLANALFTLIIVAHIGCASSGSKKNDKTFRLSETYTTCPADWERVDNNASIARDDSGYLWMIISRGGKWFETPWGVYKGTTMDNLVKQYEINPTLTDFPRPHEADTYWAGGLWIDPTDGKWYCPLHCEFNYNKFSKLEVGVTKQQRIALATSTDQGKTWKYVNDIITSDNSYNPDDYKDKTFYDQGQADHQLYYDDNFFYLFFMDGWVNKLTYVRYLAVRVARCAISDKMAPGKWQKWYNGKWTEPGLGGHCSDVFNCGGTETAAVFYSTYLNKYCALVSGGNSGTNNDPDLFMSTCTDLGRQDWAKPTKIAPAGVCGWYHWAVDKTTFSRMKIDGSSFRYYTANFSVPRWFDAEIVDNVSDTITLAPVYPPESVDDYNPGWDRVHYPISENTR